MPATEYYAMGLHGFGAISEAPCHSDEMVAVSTWQRGGPRDSL